MFKVRLSLIIVIASFVVIPAFAQKFSKKEQARREAREANFFYGASFTITTGYTHSWMTLSEVDNLPDYFGKSEKWGQWSDKFNVGFLYDHALNKKWGLQAGLLYVSKGGDHLHYYDNGLGLGNILRKEETVSAKINIVELQLQARRFFMLQPKTRLSLNAGLFIDKHFDTPENIENWNYGLQTGIGFDHKHWSVSATYQQSLYTKSVTDCKTHLNAVSINLGYRFWKK